MTTRVAINGFGRIGRAYLRCVLDANDLEVVAINDITDTETLAHLLRFDTTFGPLEREVLAADDAIVVDGHKITVTALRDPAELPWADLRIDVVAESSGRFRARESAGRHLAAGARKVVVSAPGKDLDATIVMGVNDDQYDPDRHHVVSNASCTTNCIAPMVKVLHEAFGLSQGFMTTVHAYTNDQNVLDGPHKDLRRARAAAVNIIPTTTGAARAVAEVLPAVAGRLDGLALRVPVIDGSLVDFAALLDRQVDVRDVNAAFAWAASIGPLCGRMQYATDPLVSADIIGNPASCVFDAGLTQASGRMVKVFGWYDNEWGYTARLVELTRLVASPATGR
jgi:glyceraldehyde 3-phosphate dehydrogenase